MNFLDKWKQINTQISLNFGGQKSLHGCYPIGYAFSKRLQNKTATHFMYLCTCIYLFLLLHDIK